MGRSKRVEDTTYPEGPSNGGIIDSDGLEKDGGSHEKVKIFRPYTFAVVLIVSIGGLIFGYGKASQTETYGIHVLTRVL